jgi:acyl carrier protein
MPNKLYEIMSEILDVNISEINDQSNPETITSWDSMNMYVLINEIETEFAVKFNLDEILEIKNVGDFKRQLEKHGVNINE